jgi:hypothetical protein
MPVLLDQLTGLQSPVLLGQPTGQQQTQQLVVGVPTLGTVAGNLIVKLLCEHVFPLCFTYYLFVPPAVRVQICM